LVQVLAVAPAEQVEAVGGWVAVVVCQASYGREATVREVEVSEAAEDLALVGTGVVEVVEVAEAAQEAAAVGWVHRVAWAKGPARADSPGCP
jgi:hypothetical protein